MCGLAGFWQPAGESAIDMLVNARRMAERIAHRGPDGQGSWVDERVGIALAHRRLSILDLSERAQQPMRTAAGQVLSYNGEIYNYRDLRRQLEAEGARFASDGDTEVLLQALIHWGVERTLPRLVGMFAFAYWEGPQQRLWLARDRVGIKPLYWGWQGSRLLFASELKAIRAHPSFHAKVEPEALQQYLRWRYVPGEFCIHDDFQSVEPGQVLVFHAPDRVQRHSYWSLESIHAAASWTGSAEEAGEELRALVDRATRDRCRADVPVGAFLSGGLDSSTVVASLRAQGIDPVRTFTIGFHEADYDEARHARDIAERLGTEHHQLYLDAEAALEWVPRLPRIWDEPFADSSQLPTLMVSRLAREHVKVCLSGDGGDELFGGYGRYRNVARMWQRLSAMPLAVRRGIASCWLGVDGRLQSKQRARLLACRDATALYEAMVSLWRRPPVHPATISSEHPRDRRTRPDFDRRLARAMTRWDIGQYLPGDILCKLDRASMSVGLEARVPLLDHRIVEFVVSLPDSMRFEALGLKLPLRRMLARNLPSECFDRPKQGFSVPIAEWLRGPLRDWAEDLLDPRRMEDEGHLETAVIQRTWQEHQRAPGSHAPRLWAVLMFQAWWRELRDEAGARTREALQACV